MTSDKFKKIMGKGYEVYRDGEIPVVDSCADDPNDNDDWAYEDIVSSLVDSAGRAIASKVSVPAPQRPIPEELLRYFTSEEAEELTRYFRQTPSTRTQSQGCDYSLRNLGINARSRLEKELEGQDIIEFGNAGRGRNPELDTFGICDYQGVDPKQDEDALSYLINVDDESAIVCSFGVLDFGVLSRFGQNEEMRGLLDRYITALVEETHRVTPKGAITLHGTDNNDFLMKFADEDVLYDGRDGIIAMYRKQ